MTFYLLLIIAFGIVILVSITVLILGIVKKRKSGVMTAAILFTIGITGCVFSGWMYSKMVYAYMRSSDFQKVAKKGAELAGETMGSVSSGLSKGLSETLDDEAIAGLAKKSAHILGRSIKTVASDLDSTIGSKNLFVDQNLAEAGFELGRADERYQSKTSDVGIFISYKKNFTGKLKLTNYDQTGKKIDVAEKDITTKAGQERVEVFSFLYADLGITTYYILSKAN